ncbi:MAG: 1-acyl-sn-glycerol-3-phosphate acyltransferase [Planctomycetes bacterium]|nr:1-acyl-sn-glycerol-3-phosphate acyltransferase [Planctomycetota bacterium]
MLRSIAWVLAAAWFGLYHALRTSGGRHVPLQGPVVVASNHQSYYDPFPLSLGTPRVMRFITWDAVFRWPVLGPMAAALGAFPVRLERPGRDSLEVAEGLLRGGGALGIFPEGGRADRGGHMDPFKPGAVRLALKTGATLVPATITGAWECWPRSRIWPRPGPMRVRFHPPLLVGDGVGEPRRDRERERELGLALEARIGRRVEAALRARGRRARLLSRPARGLAPLDLLPWGLAMVAPGGAATGLALAQLAWAAADLALVPQGVATKSIRDLLPVAALAVALGGVLSAPWAAAAALAAVGLAAARVRSRSRRWRRWATVLGVAAVAAAAVG